MNDNSLRYRSYLLRLYAANHSGRLQWRASLENPHSGERLGFSSIELLFRFLKDQCEDSVDRLLFDPHEPGEE